MAQAGSLLLMDIEVDPFAREHSLKQRSQLFGRGQIGKRSPVSPEHYPRLQPPSHRPQRPRPGYQGPPFFPSRRFGRDSMVGFSVSAGSSSEAGRRP